MVAFVVWAELKRTLVAEVGTPLLQLPSVDQLPGEPAVQMSNTPNKSG